MDLLIFATSSNMPLVDDLLDELKEIPTFSKSRLAKMALKFHPDKEPYVEIHDNIRRGQRRKCVVIGNISSDENGSVNDHAMELFVLLDAIKRADAKIEILLLPYLPYARQDRRRGKETDRTAITAALFAHLIDTVAPYRRGCFVEPHDDRIQGFFKRPFERIPVIHTFVEPILSIFDNPDKIVVVSPDRGGFERASALATMLGTPHAIAWVDKRRTGPGEARALQLIGEVKDLDAVLVDDMIDTAGTLCEAVNKLREEGARRIVVCAAHGLFNGNALERIETCGLEKIFVTSSVAQKPETLACGKVKVIPIGALLASAIHRLLAGESLRALGKPRKR
jgi:ribose-phosphate pyrophosphokinase